MTRDGDRGRHHPCSLQRPHEVAGLQGVAGFSDNVLFRNILVFDSHRRNGGRHGRNGYQLLPAGGGVAVGVEGGRGGPDVTWDGNRGRHHPRPLQRPYKVAGLQGVVDVVVWNALVDVVPVLHPVLGLLLLRLVLGALVDGDRGQGGPLVVPEGDVPLEGQEGWLWQEVPVSKKRWLVVIL